MQLLSASIAFSEVTELIARVQNDFEERKGESGQEETGRRERLECKSF